MHQYPQRCKNGAEQCQRRIYADTFHSQREANLDSYMGDLYFSSAYQDALRTDFIQGLTDRIVLENENYTLSNIRLDFSQHGNDSGKIEYIFSCDAQFRFQMFGEAFPPFSRHITLTGSLTQNIKFCWLFFYSNVYKEKNLRKETSQ